jgi:hypothetical protein
MLKEPGKHLEVYHVTPDGEAFFLRSFYTLASAANHAQKRPIGLVAGGSTIVVSMPSGTLHRAYSEAKNE